MAGINDDESVKAVGRPFINNIVFMPFCPQTSFNTSIDMSVTCACILSCPTSEQDYTYIDSGFGACSITFLSAISKFRNPPVRFNDLKIGMRIARISRCLKFQQRNDPFDLHAFLMQQEDGRGRVVFYFKYKVDGGARVIFWEFTGSDPWGIFRDKY